MLKGWLNGEDTNKNITVSFKFLLNFWICYCCFNIKTKVFSHHREKSTSESLKYSVGSELSAEYHLLLPHTSQECVLNVCLTCIAGLSL